MKTFFALLAILLKACFDCFLTSSLPSFFAFFPNSTPYDFKYHFLNSVASIYTIPCLTNVLVLTNSLFEALYVTFNILTCFVTAYEAHEKFPLSNLNALNL